MTTRKLNKLILTAMSSTNKPFSMDDLLNCFYAPEYDLNCAVWRLVQRKLLVQNNNNTVSLPGVK